MKSQKIEVATESMHITFYNGEWFFGGDWNHLIELF